MSLFENKIIERIRSTRNVDIYCGYGEYTKVSAYIIWTIYKKKKNSCFGIGIHIVMIYLYHI